MSHENCFSPPHRSGPATALSGFLALLVLVTSAAVAQDTPVLIRDARVFDGEQVLEDASVLFHEGTILAVGTEVEAPGDATVVEGSGHTVLPGLIDSHTHTFVVEALEQALDFGVTTELDMFTAPLFAATMRAQQEKGVTDRADLFSAGYLVTAADGHGTQYGLPVPTIESPEQADEAVELRAEQGSDYIKIIVEAGWSGYELPTLDMETVAAVVEAAHERDLLAVVHVSTVPTALAVLETGADGLVHAPVRGGSPELDAELVERLEASGAFVAATMTVHEGGRRPPEALQEDPQIAPWLDSTQRGELSASFPGDPDERPSLWGGFVARVGGLIEAGVPILAATDAPNPGTSHGVSLHRELALLVEAGATPLEALRSATSRPADIFGLDDRGRLQPGRRADLLLVEGDPTTDILATRSLRAIYRNGQGHERSLPSEEPAGPTREPATVGPFEEELTAPYGTWTESTDSLMGGTSTVELGFVGPGADDTATALVVEGTLTGDSPFPWAGPMHEVGNTPMSGIDLSAADGVVFWARGEGDLNVMLFAEAFGTRPRWSTVTLSPQWQRFEIPFETFGTDGSDLLGLLFTAVGQGPFRFELDEVTYR